MPFLVNKSTKALCAFHNKKITHISIAVEQPLTKRAFCQDCAIPNKEIATMEQVENLLKKFTGNQISQTNPKINEKMIEFFQAKQMIQDELNAFSESLEKEIGNMICSEILPEINNVFGQSQIKLKELQKLGELLSSKFFLSGYDFSMKSKNNQQAEIFYVHQRTQFLQQIYNQITSFRRQIQFKHSSTIQLLQPLQKQQSFLEPESLDKAHYVEQLLDNKDKLKEQINHSYTFSDLVYAKLSGEQFREQIAKEKEQITDLTNHIRKMEEVFLKQIEILSKDTTTNELKQDLQTALPDFDKYREKLQQRQNKIPELLKFQEYSVKPIILQGHLDEVHGIAINDSLIASGGADKTIRIWNLTEFKQIKELKGHQNWIITLAFSRDQKWLSSSAASPDNIILLWDLSTYTLQGQFIHHKHIHRQIFTPDSQSIMSACEDHSIYVWDIEVKIIKQIIQNNASPVCGICIWENQQKIGSICSDGMISLNEFSSGIAISSWSAHADGGCCIDISKDNTLLLSSGVCGLLKLWNWRNQEMIKQLQGHQQDTVWTTLFLTDPKTVISISFVGRVRIWDVQSGTILQEYMVIGGDDQYPQIVQSRNGRYLVGGGSNYQVKVWQLNREERVKQLQQ